MKRIKRKIAVVTAIVMTISSLPLTAMPAAAKAENTADPANITQVTAVTDSGSGRYAEDGYLLVADYSELYKACLNGKESKIRLDGDITADTAITSEIYINCDTVIDLAGNDIERNCKAESYSENALFCLYKGDLTIEDSKSSGTVKVTANNKLQSMVRTECGRKLTVNGGEFVFVTSEYGGRKMTFTADMMNIWGSDVEIYGGTFYVGKYCTPITLTPYSDGTQKVNSTCLIAGGTINCYASISMRSIKGADYRCSFVMSHGIYNNRSLENTTTRDGTVATDIYLARNTGTEEINVSVIEGEIPKADNGTTIYYPAGTATEDFTLETGMNGVRAFSKTFIGADDCGFTMTDARHVLGRNEITRLKKGKLDLTDREAYTVKSNNVGMLTMYHTRKTGATVSPLSRVIWQISDDYGKSWKTVMTGNTSFYTPPAVNSAGVVVYRAVANYNGVNIDNYFVVNYDFKIIRTVSLYIDNFRPHRTAGELKIDSVYPDKYTAEIDRVLLNQWDSGAELGENDELVVEAAYTIDLKITAKPGYALASEGLTVRLNRYTDIGEWQTADSISGNIATFDEVIVPFEYYNKNVEVSIDEPVVNGFVPTELNGTLPGYFRLWKIIWNDAQTGEEVSRIEYGKEYDCFIYLDCNGYELAYNRSMEVNGKALTTEIGHDDDEDIDYISAYLTYRMDKPSAPEIKVTSTGTDNVTVSWEHNDYVHGYRIETVQGDKQTVSWADSKADYAVIKGLEQGTEYQIRVAGYLNSTTEKIYGDYSNTVNAVTAIPAPEEFRASAVGPNYAKLEWKPDSVYNGYIVEQYKGGKWIGIYSTTNRNAASCTANRLAPDSTYTFRLRAVRKTTGGYVYSGYARLAVKTALENVKQFSATAVSSSAVKLEWSKNDKATGYIVEQYKGGKWMQIAVTKNNSTLTFTVKGLADTTPYSFRIKSYKTADGKTNYSGYITTKATTLPAAVSGAKATSTTATWITLEWERNAKVTGYVIEQYKGGKWTEIAVTKNNTTLKFTVKGLKPDTTYSFRIKAYKTVGTETMYGNYVRISGTTRMANVSSFRGTAVSKTAVKLGWNRNDNASGYIIEQYKGGKWTQINVIRDNSITEQVVGSLSAGTTYSFRIKSFRAVDGNYKYSEYISAKVTTLN